MLSMSEKDVAAGVRGTETEAEGWLILRVCELDEGMVMAHVAQASYR